MRQTKERAALPRGVSTDISKLSAGVNRADVALNALKNSSLSPRQIHQLRSLAREYEKPAFIAGEITISNHATGLAAHLLGELLGNDMQLLKQDWNGRADFNEFVDPAKLESFKELRTMSNIMATVICATLYKKATDAGLDFTERHSRSWENTVRSKKQFSEAAQEFLIRLAEGDIFTRNGSIYVDQNGRLRAFYFTA